MGSRFDVQEYGRLEYGPDVYPLMAIRSRNWRADRGVIQYPLAQLGLCTSMTNARFRTTTEVYPDSAG